MDSASSAVPASMPAAQAEASERAAFIRRTYLHLAMALVAFAVLEAMILPTPLAKKFATWVLASGGMTWLMVLGGFMLVGWMARSIAASGASPAMQYAGLALYVAAEAVIFIPILYIAVYYSSDKLLPTAAVLTGLLFAGLTFTAFTTRKDFSFLGSILTIGGFIALGLIVCGALFGFSLGLWFSVFMIVFASGAILYDTSKIIHHYPTDRHVAASLELFASVALLLWYVITLLLHLSSD